MVPSRLLQIRWLLFRVRGSVIGEFEKKSDVLTLPWRKIDLLGAKKM